MALDEAKEERKERRMRKRWGGKPVQVVVAENNNNTAVCGSSNTTNNGVPLPPPPTSQTPPAAVTAVAAAVMDATDPKARILTMQESVRARLAASKQALQQQQATSAVIFSNSNSGYTANSSSGILKRPASDAFAPIMEAPKSAKRAKVYELDLSVTAPTFQEERSFFVQKASSGRRRRTRNLRALRSPWSSMLCVR